MNMDYDTVCVPQTMVKKETFALRVKGNSMIEEGIEDGDIVIIERRNSAENGESVVVKINDEEVRLQPANSEKQPIFLKSADIEILDIVAGILCQPLG